MARRATYIRAWRKKEGHTLDELVSRLEAIGVETTAATLSRIERGKQPYSQDILEALAEVLGKTVAHLIEHDPDIPRSVVIDFVSRLDAKQAQQAEGVLRAMFGTTQA